MSNSRILIVDDTPANIKVLSDLLREDYALSVATSGQAALELAFAADSRPDLVLLDVMMPEMDGYEVCRRLKANERTRDIPVIFVTAMHEVDDEAKGFELGAVDYVTKPVSPPIVKSRVRSAVGLRMKSQELQALSGKLAKYLSPQVYQAIFEGRTQATVESRRKKLSIFFSDIVGFTATTERMEAEEISGLLNSYLEAMSRICIKHGGTIDKFIGDAILIFFGDPTSRGEKEDAVACVSMAMEMREALVELRKQWYARGIETPFQVRIGINSGYCTVGNFGSTERIDYTIIGSQVNIAARLETAAAPGQILISHDTYGLVKDKIHCVRKAPLQLKGIPYPLMTYEAVDFAANAVSEDESGSVGRLLESSEPVSPDTVLRNLAGRFGNDPFAVAVVLEDEVPVGLVKNAALMALRGTCAAESSWQDRHVREIMQPQLLVVEAAAQSVLAARKAAGRAPGQELDPVVVTRHDAYAGIVPVRALLAQLTAQAGANG